MNYPIFSTKKKGKSLCAASKSAQHHDADDYKIQIQDNMLESLPIDTLSSEPPPQPPPAPAKHAFLDATAEDRELTEELVGRRCEIWWDGDAVFFSGRIIGYDELNMTHKVKYDDGDEDPYEEDLRNLESWRLFSGSELDFQIMRAEQIAAQKRKDRRAPKTSFEEMVVAAVMELGERCGSSLVSIRRAVLELYPDTQKKQAASFNSLSMKALASAVAKGKLERDKHTYKLATKFVKQMNKKPAQPQRPHKAGESRAARASRNTGDEFYGTAAEHNRLLRAQMVERRVTRDAHLLRHMDSIAPFLQDTNNYFQRLKTAAAVPSIIASSAADLSKDESETATALLNEPSLLSTEVPAEETTTTDEVGTAVAAPVVGEGEGEGEVDDRLSALLAMRGVVPVEQPPLLVAELHEHQTLGISWMVHMFQLGMPMILGDQMGLGKTVQTIGLIAALHHYHAQRGPHLIVVPLSVLSNWIAEIERFCPSLRAVRFHGPKSERERMKTDELNDAQNFDIVVTTFEMLVAEANFFRRRFVWTLVVVDEGHRLKNEKSLLSDRLRTVPALSRVILTGTPLQNNLRELWALLHFLLPDVFSRTTAEKFEEGFDLVRNKIDNAVLRRARKMLTLFMLRRIKEQVSIKLPSRKEVTVLVPLTEQQVFWYKHMICGVDHELIDIVMNNSSTSAGDGAGGLQQLSTSTTAVTEGEEGETRVAVSSTKKQDATNAGVSGESDYKKLMNLLLQLRKICNHTYLMPDLLSHSDSDSDAAGEVGGRERGDSSASEDIVSGSGKLRMLDRMLPLLQAGGHRVLLFSQFTSMLDILEEYCDLRGWTYLRLDGSTNRVQRRLDVRRFNAPRSSVFVFLISTRAGGLGLNLASADTVILYDSDWNPQVDLQAMERAHRIGQTKPVRVFRLICRGSVEERMLCRAEKKLFLNAMVAEAGEDAELQEDEDSLALGIGGGTMSKGELASLIRFGANAVLDKGAGELSDADLHQLLEVGGRDLGGRESAVSEEVLDTAAASAAIRSRLEMKEIDLHQLGDLQYTKKSLSKAQQRRDELLDQQQQAALVGLEGGRVRKSRIVMVDGRGSGYGGDVPVLGEYLDAPKTTGAGAGTAKPAKSNRSRAWLHQSFCCLCGNKRRPEDMVICAHCPKSFHRACMQEAGLDRGAASAFQCPLHRCVACGRSTVAAGGLLFRCLCCLTSYCEDCLPQEEIESVGRCRALEEVGYFSSHQAYYIKCPHCCVADGVKASGVDGGAPASDEEGEEEDGGGSVSEAEEVAPWDTQLMRVFSEYTPDAEELAEERRRAKQQAKEDERLQKEAAKRDLKEQQAIEAVAAAAVAKEEKELKTAGKKRGRGFSAAKAAGAVDTSPRKAVSKDDDEVKEEVKVSPKKKRVRAHHEEPADDPSGPALALGYELPASCSLDEALDLLSAHPRAAEVFVEISSGYSDTGSCSGGGSGSGPSLVGIRSKVFTGKYRNPAAFVSDVRAVLRPSSKSADKEKQQERLELLAFFEEQLVSILHL